MVVVLFANTLHRAWRTVGVQYTDFEKSVFFFSLSGSNSDVETPRKAHSGDGYSTDKGDASKIMGKKKPMCCGSTFLKNPSK